MNTNFDLFISLIHLNVPHWFSYGHLVSQNLSKYETEHFVCLQAFGLACILVFSFCTPFNLLCMDVISSVNLI